ncbi:MAG: thermonuclease family protein [Deltaproteobacteria bacterium]|nr:thermonuclease family protein [Deltaproteobacteria bacterium]
MGLKTLKVIQGRLMIEGKQPDGDSLRFKAKQPDHYADLYRSYRIEPGKDGTVQLRLQGIDAPETHYGSAAQPLGDAARDRLLQVAGFKSWTLAENGKTIERSKPKSVPAAILTDRADAHGRPVAFVLVGRPIPASDGEPIAVGVALVRQTINFEMVASGDAYPLFYRSMPAAHRRVFRTAAEQARRNGLGVWSEDSTSEFELRQQDDVGVNGALIFPKLFRRATDFLRDRVESKSRFSLKAWMKARDEDDLVVHERTEVRLSSFIRQSSTKVRVLADVLDMVFVERDG